MARVVISFVGKCGKEVEYQFPEATTRRLRRRFFLPALVPWLARHGKPVHKVVVIGSATSEWPDLERELNALPIHLPPDIAPPAYRRVEMREATDGAIYGETLEVIRSAIEPGDQVVLDLSQGMRHQPLIALLAALYLDRLPANRDVTIEHVFSASVERDADDNIIQPVPVRDLRPILDLAAWVFALGAFDASGDTGVFTKLLEKDENDDEAVELLRQGAALERATRPEAAAEIARAKRLLTPAGATAVVLDGAGAAFAPDLERALAWSGGADEIARKAALSDWYLERGDPLRGGVYLFEAMVAKLVAGRSPRPQSDGEVKDMLERYIQRCSDRVLQRSMFSVRRLRNLLAHASEFDPKGYDDWRQKLDAELKDLLTRPADLVARLKSLHAYLLAETTTFP